MRDHRRHGTKALFAELDTANSGASDKLTLSILLVFPFRCIYDFRQPVPPQSSAQVP